MNLKSKLFLIAAAIVISGCSSLHRQSPVTVSVNAENPGAQIPQDFSGLSFEVVQLLPDTNGVRYFRADNATLINLFHTFGIKNLRIGGNTSDRNATKLPDHADIDSLFAFAKAANVKVIYCLRLHDGDAQEDAQLAKYIMGRYAGEMDCFSIGQEPSAYPAAKVDARAQDERMGAANENFKYISYRDEWKKFADAIIAAVPDVKFCGPGVHNNGQWAIDFMHDFGKTNHVALITEHLYPGGPGGKVPSPQIGIDRMLADNDATNSFPRTYEKLYASFAPAAISNGLPYRLEEVNSYFNGGATNVSNTFASALWGLSFMYWWAEHDAAGVNFHTGDNVAAGARLLPSKYTAYVTATNGYHVRPLGYGIKAFDIGSRGKILTAKISGVKLDSNLEAHAVLGDDKNIYVTLINKSYGANANAEKISLNINGKNFSSADAMSLVAPENNIIATEGETLGGSEISNAAQWSGSWRPISGKSIYLPATSAVIVKLKAD